MIAAAAPQHLPGVLHTLEPTLDHYGYLAVVGLVFIEDFGVPVPGETILILGAVYAGDRPAQRLPRGAARFLRRRARRQRRVRDRALRRAPPGRTLRPLHLAHARALSTGPRQFFERHGGKIIIAARFIEGLRQANGIIAGTTGMHWESS